MEILATTSGGYWALSLRGQYWPQENIWQILATCATTSWGYWAQSRGLWPPFAAPWCRDPPAELLLRRSGSSWPENSQYMEDCPGKSCAGNNHLEGVVGLNLWNALPRVLLPGRGPPLLHIQHTWLFHKPVKLKYDIIYMSPQIGPY